MMRSLILASAAALFVLLSAVLAAASEADLVLPDVGQEQFLGMSGRTLLMGGLVVSLAGVGFGLVMFFQLRNLPVHRSMRDISELIYETCKTYLISQGQIHPAARAVHRRGDGDLLRLAPRIAGQRVAIIVRSAWSASRAATAWRGSAFASTRTPIRGRRLPAWPASRFRCTRFRCRPASASARC